MWAAVCPGCGARWRPPRWAVVGLVIAICIGAVGTLAGSGSKRKPAESAPVKSTKPDVATSTGVVDGVTLPKLFAEYRANEIAADAAYRDQVLRVTAIVGRVGKDLGGKPFIDLHLGGKSDGFRAAFRTETGLAALKSSQTVTMRCLGGSSLGRPTLTDCMIERGAEDAGSGSASGSAPPQR